MHTKGKNTFRVESVEGMIKSAEELTKGWLVAYRGTPIVISLVGEIGAGKTHFAKGIAKALGIKREVTSPSYTYIAEYPFSVSERSGKFYHVDGWRMESEEALGLLRVEETVVDENVVAIEWARGYEERLKVDFPEATFLTVDIYQLEDDTREIKLS